MVYIGYYSHPATFYIRHHSRISIYVCIYICIYVPLFFVNLIQLLQNGSSTQGLYIHKR